MTVSKTHPIKMNQLLKLIEQLPSIPKKIYFVVPKGIIFDQFQLQDFHTIGDKKVINARNIAQCLSGGWSKRPNDRLNPLTTQSAAFHL